MMNGRETGKPTLNILLLFNLSTFFLLPHSHRRSLLNKSLFFIFLYSSARALHTAEKALHSKNIRLIYTAVIRPLDLKQSGTCN